MTPYRTRLISLTDPPLTPARTPSGASINTKIVRSLEGVDRAALACSRALDRCIELGEELGKKIRESIPPPAGAAKG